MSHALVAPPDVLSQFPSLNSGGSMRLQRSLALVPAMLVACAGMNALATVTIIGGLGSLQNVW